MFPATTRAKASSAVSVHMSPAPTPAHIAGVDAIDRGARTSKLATAVIDVEFFDPGKNTNDIVVVFNPVAKLKRLKCDDFGCAHSNQKRYRTSDISGRDFAFGVVAGNDVLLSDKTAAIHVRALRDRELAIFVFLENLPARGHIRRPRAVEVERVSAVTDQ